MEFLAARINIIGYEVNFKFCYKKEPNGSSNTTPQ